jgi:hypothetical protein
VARPMDVDDHRPTLGCLRSDISIRVGTEAPGNVGRWYIDAQVSPCRTDAGGTRWTGRLWPRMIHAE